MNQQDTADNAQASSAETSERAALYVRVSSTGQLGRDGDEDGYSIPAQVKACEQEARSLDAQVVKAYVERAESAKSDDRPVLQQMMRELPSLGVRYLIVHKVDRLARNRLDDAVLYQKLVGMGIKLVSVSENIDETPAGRLMHGMLASFSEYYSLNLASEIKKGLRQKHENGGTPFRPPLGYLSKRELIGGRDIRSVIIDPERAPLIKLAFTLYATGTWSLHALAEHLEEQGLRYRATARYPERPVAHNRVHDILRNEYYRGIVAWDGRRFPGRHEPLVDADTFDRVQILLKGARIGGDRAQIHEHYLRGTVVCDRCQGRLLFGRHRGRSGAYYEYFSCTNRAARRRRGTRCASGHYSVAVVEREVENLYAKLAIDPETQAAIRQELHDGLEERTALIRQEAERHERAVNRIESKQAKLIDLYYRDLVSDEVFEREQAKLKSERRDADRLRREATLQTQEVEAALNLALQRATEPQQVYLQATPIERRAMNRAVFERIEVGEHGDIAKAIRTPVYEALAAWQGDSGDTDANREAGAGEAQCSAYVRPCTAPVHFGKCLQAGGLMRAAAVYASAKRHRNARPLPNRASSERRSRRKEPCARRQTRRRPGTRNQKPAPGIRMTDTGAPQVGYPAGSSTGASAVEQAREKRIRFVP